MEEIVSEIRGFEPCRARLADLLAQADELRVSKDGARADALADALAAFANASRPDDPGDAAEVAAIAKLDALAVKVRDEMTAIALGQAVDDVASHAAELDALASTIGQHAHANANAARHIRLAPVRDLIDRITDTVTAAKIAAKSLDVENPDEAAIEQQIAGLAERLEMLIGAARAAVDRGAG